MTLFFRAMATNRTSAPAETSAKGILSAIIRQRLAAHILCAAILADGTGPALRTRSARLAAHILCAAILADGTGPALRTRSARLAARRNVQSTRRRSIGRTIANC